MGQDLSFVQGSSWMNGLLDKCLIQLYVPFLCSVKMSGLKTKENRGGRDTSKLEAEICMLVTIIIRGHVDQPLPPGRFP